MKIIIFQIIKIIFQTKIILLNHKFKTNQFHFLNLQSIFLIKNNYIIYSEYEKRVIDEVLEISGISNKPTESQLKEFNKRIKTLNNEIIFNSINERIMNKINQNDNKMVIVRLFFFIILLIIAYFICYRIYDKR
jgi:hypothetical protein